MYLTSTFALYAREVKRFQKIWLDTLVSPIMSMVLFLSVFGIVSGGRVIDGIPYLAFVYTGLLTMTLINSSFSNPAFALVISKNVGTFLDLQLTPVPAWGVGVAYALAACTRAVLTLAVSLAVTIWFIPIHGVAHPFVLLLGLFLSGMEFGMLGVIFGMVAKNFEALTFVTTFVIQPMIFLAGTFYPTSTLSGPWPLVSQFNPMHHSVNLIRYAVTGYADASPMLSLSVVAFIGIAAFIPMQMIVRKKLKH